MRETDLPLLSSHLSAPPLSLAEEPFYPIPHPPRTGHRKGEGSGDVPRTTNVVDETTFVRVYWPKCTSPATPLHPTLPTRGQSTSTLGSCQVKHEGEVGRTGISYKTPKGETFFH